MSDGLTIADSEGVRHLVLDRPERRNALSLALRSAIISALEAAALDDQVGAVVISGSGEHFCAGFDLKELSEAPDPAALFADSGRYHHSVHTFSKPLVAAVDGSALAGGLDLALMCDLRISAVGATFGQPQVRRGIPAAYELLASVVGDSSARDLCLTGRIIDAQEALAIGLVGQVVESSALDQTVHDLAAQIAAVPNTVAMKQRIITAQPHLFDPD